MRSLDKKAGQRVIGHVLAGSIRGASLLNLKAKREKDREYDMCSIDEKNLEISINEQFIVR